MAIARKLTIIPAGFWQVKVNGRKLKETEANMSWQVSINTDDQGVFDTSLENEYALMTVALKKSQDRG